MSEIFRFDISTGAVEGAQRWERRLSDMSEAFASGEAVVSLLREGNPLIYEVYEVQRIPATTGELIWSVTVLSPGKVGKEYYMTKGHYHRDPSCSEIYLVLSGQGFLILKGGEAARAYPVSSGTLVHIPPGHAHRVVNTGPTALVFFAVYPAQAGHDYERVRREGFGLRVIERDGSAAIQQIG